MQRWLIFIFCLPLMLFGQSEKQKALSTELSYWLSGPMASGNQNEITGRAIVRFINYNSTQSVSLEVGGLEIESIKNKEGRLKEDLAFTKVGEQIKVEAALEINQTVEWQIEFKVPIGNDDFEEDIFIGESLMVLNPKSRVQSGYSSSAVFFPKLNNQEHPLMFNITYDSEKSLTFPGEMEFVVSENSNYHTEFWRTQSNFKPSVFYLFISDLKESEADDPDQEFELATIALDAIRASNAPTRMKPAFEFYNLDYSNISDSMFVELDSLSEQIMKGFFIVGNEPELDLSTENLKRLKVVALYKSSNDTSRASEFLWQTLQSEKPEGWVQKVMSYKWEHKSEIDKQFVDRLYHWRFEEYRKANVFLFDEADSLEIDTAYLRPFIVSKAWSEISLSYGYKGTENRFQIKYIQDSLVAPSYAIPAKVTIFTNTEVIEEVIVLKGFEGVINVPCFVAPGGATISFGENWMGTFKEKKPDSYLLFQLNKAETVTQREEALRGLFEAENPNLFSTALGIAMRDEEPRIRVLALKSAGDLNLAQQQKLKRTIEGLTEDGNEEVQKLAKELQTKYYLSK